MFLPIIGTTSYRISFLSSAGKGKMGSIRYKSIKSLKPFLSWAGGKKQLLSDIKRYVPYEITTYYEPFLGGGSVLFDLMPQIFVVNDINAEIINAYRVIEMNMDALIAKLKSHKNNHRFFYKMRGLDRTNRIIQLSDVERAARTIYLNKTCFNGLFRVNSKGQFNSPYGYRKNPNIVNVDILTSINHYFNRADGAILNVDFEQAVEAPAKGSFVYLDPPYDPISASSSFTSYTKEGFDRSEQKRLKKFCDKLQYYGCRFLLSNSSTGFIHDLYKDYRIETVKAKRNINCKGTGRGVVNEVLIRNYE